MGTFSNRGQWLFLSLILLAGLALRISYLREIAAAPEFATPIADAAFHDYWARALVSGEWTPPDGEPDPRIREVPFLRPPGYPYFLAAVYRVAGTEIVGPRLVQMLLGLVNCLLAFLLGRALFGPAAGLLSAAFGAAYWAFPYFEGELQAPVLIVTLALALVLVLHRWLRRRSLGAAIAAGVLGGLLALTRANALLFLPVAALWMVGARRREGSGGGLGHAAVFLVFSLLAIAPATLRNAVVADDFVLISSNGAINLYIGNNEESDGVTPRIPELQRWTGMSGWSWFSYDRIVQGISRHEERELTYSEASAFFTGKALEFMREHPGDFLKLCLKRAYLFWGPDEISNNKAIRFEKANSETLRRNVSFPLVLAVALAGLVLFLLDRRRRAAESEAAGPTLVLVGLLILVTFISFVPFLAAARFRVPLLPFVFLFGAYGLSRIAGLVSSKAWGRLAAAAVAGGAAFFLVSAGAQESEVDKAWWHTDRANALALAGETEAALDEFRAALAENPGYVDAHVHMAQALFGEARYDEAAPHLEQVLANRPYRNDLRMQLGSVYMLRGEHARAAGLFQTAVSIDPNVAEGHFELGRALTEAGRLEEGIVAFRKSLELSPDQAEAHVNLGIVLGRLGRHEEAIAEYREALEVNPFSATAHYNLGNALQATGALEEAAEAHREAIRIEPKYVEPHVHLGNLHNERSEFAEAVAWYEKAVKIDPDHRIARFNLSAALGNLGRVDEAIALCEAALKQNPADDMWRQRLAALERYRDQLRQRP